MRRDGTGGPGRPLDRRLADSRATACKQCRRTIPDRGPLWAYLATKGRLFGRSMLDPTNLGRRRIRQEHSSSASIRWGLGFCVPMALTPERSPTDRDTRMKNREKYLKGRAVAADATAADLGSPWKLACQQRSSLSVCLYPWALSSADRSRTQRIQGDDE